MSEERGATASLTDRVRSHLAVLYPPANMADKYAGPEGLDVLSSAVLSAMGLEAAEPRWTEQILTEQTAPEQTAPKQAPAEPRWTERDIAVITQPDLITEPGTPPLQTLLATLTKLASNQISIVHLLPFFPASSDGGFAVIDHTEVAPALGTWADVEALAEQFTLMVDLVCGHVSCDHRWVREFRSGLSPGAHCLMTASTTDDLSSVVRPRAHPLLQPVDTPTGERHLWCTFSPDQIDINYHHPDALLELLSILDTLLRHGARWVRLDAIAYLWKELGTTCIHLPQVHEMVKLLRTLIDARSALHSNGDHDTDWDTDRDTDRHPSTVLVTETNVPHAQNISYFGDDDEANVVYNFSLAPLLLHTFLSGSAAVLQRWVADQEPATTAALPSAATTYLNFIASHDGIGLRPAEGLLTDAEIERLINAAHAAGGWHTHYNTANGQRPYELNVSLFELFTAANGKEGAAVSITQGVEHYLAAHTIMLSLAGVPAFYLHSLLGTPHPTPGAKYLATVTVPVTSGDENSSPRAINRQKLLASGLDELLDADNGLRRSVLSELLRRTRIRRGESAFHPNSPQQSLVLNDRVFALVRGGATTGPASSNQIVSLTNVAGTVENVNLNSTLENVNLNSTHHGDWIDLLSGRSYSSGSLDAFVEPIVLEAGQTVWLKRTS